MGGCGEQRPKSRQLTDAERFAFGLALESGFWVVNPRLMLELMPATVWQDWQKYYQSEPFGALREDVRAATIAAVVANTHSDGKKTFKVNDFLAGKMLRVPERLTDAQRKAKAIAVARALGAKIVRVGKANSG